MAITSRPRLWADLEQVGAQQRTDKLQSLYRLDNSSIATTLFGTFTLSALMHHVAACSWGSPGSNKNTSILLPILRAYLLPLLAYQSLYTIPATAHLRKQNGCQRERQYQTASNSKAPKSCQSARQSTQSAWPHHKVSLLNAQAS